MLRPDAIYHRAAETILRCFAVCPPDEGMGYVSHVIGAEIPLSPASQGVVFIQYLFVSFRKDLSCIGLCDRTTMETSFRGQLRAPAIGNFISAHFDFRLVMLSLHCSFESITGSYFPPRRGK